MFKPNLKLFAKGFCIGSADVVPGVSGGTMAFILGIYPQLINAIKSFNLDWLKSVIRFDIKGAIAKPHLSFLIPLFVGAFVALLFFTRVVPLPTLIKTEPEIIYGLFFGLIVGSILFMFKQAGLKNLGQNLPFLLVGLVFGGFVVTLVPASTPNAAWFIFLCGALAISAMLLPGISGSFILLMMKKYAYIFDAIGQFDFSIIIPFAFGMLAGVIFFSRLLSFLLKNLYQQTVQFIIGLLLASLYVIWPFQLRSYEIIRGKERLMSSVPYLPDLFDKQVIISLTMLLIGLIVVILLERIAEKSTVDFN